MFETLADRIEYERSKPKNWRKNKRIMERVKAGKCTEEEAERMLLKNILYDLHMAEDWSDSWMECIAFAKENLRGGYKDYLQMIREGDDSPMPLMRSYAKDFKMALDVSLQEYGKSILMSRSTIESIGCYLHNTTGNDSLDDINRYVREVLTDSPLFDEVWDENRAEDIETNIKANIYVDPDHGNHFRPEREDMLKYMFFLEGVYDWIELKKIVPVNKWGEFIDMKTGQALPIGWGYMTKGVEHGMPDLAHTAKDYPRMDFEGVIPEEEPADIKDAYRYTNTLNSYANGGRTIQKSAKFNANTGTPDLTMAYELSGEERIRLAEEMENDSRNFWDC